MQTGSGMQSSHNGGGILSNLTDEPAPILIVDDTVFIIQYLTTLLEQKFKVSTDKAISGEEAILKCRHRKDRGQDTYRLILMDI